MCTALRSTLRAGGAAALALLIVLPSPAHAQYLDPGAGSLILQLVIAGAVGVAATVKLYWRRITEIFARRSKNADS